MKRKLLCGFMALTALVMLNSCATTSLTAVWKDSNYKGGPIKKVLIIGVFTEPHIRKFFEDEFAWQLKSRGIDAVPAYTIFPEDTILDKEMIVEKIKELRMDSVLVTRLVDVRDIGGYDTYPTEVNPGGDFYAYYVMCCQTAVTLGYVVVLETKIFEEKYYKLIWSALSETSLQRSTESTIRSFIPAAIENLHVKKLIQ
jgi:hypothetical protein